MKKILIGTSALIGAGLLASHAAHADDKGIKLTVGGFFNTFYILNFDDDRKGVTNDNNDGGLTDVSGAAGLPLPVGYGTTYQGNVYNVRPSAFNNGIAGIPRGFVSDPVVGAGTPVLDNQVPGGNINTDQNSFRHGRYKLRYAVRRNPDGSPATDPVTGRPIIDTYAIYRSRTNRDAGFRANIDSLTNDSEIHFKGETTLDNGLTVGVHVELEGDPKNNQIDQSYAYFKGGFGELHIGNDSDALGKACVTAPGGLGSFGAFSQNGTGSHYEQALGVGSNFNCATINGTATEILYETPEFAGFQLLLSYSPDNGIRSQNSQTFGNGTPYVQRGQNLHEFSAYATYTLEGDGWSLNWGGGGEWGFNSGLGTDSIYAKGYEFDQTEDGHVRHHNRAGPNSYQTGLVGTIGGFKVGGNFQLLDFGLGK
ncbi:MAG TPA: porin, partial [Dongiaceae bacterium]|nr:porin [Dongiaceae bacterium]